MSIGEVIRYNLIQDNVDSTAQQVYLANTMVFSSSADVPVWMYTSLSTLLGCPSADIGSFIIGDLGEAKVPTSPSIVIQTDNSYEAVDVGQGLKADTPGNDTCFLEILVKNVKANKSIYLVKNVLQRCRYLLDSNIRQYSNPARYVDLEINSNEFVKSYFRCYYRSLNLPIASEAALSLQVSFIWQFGASSS